MIEMKMKQLNLELNKIKVVVGFYTFWGQNQKNETMDAGAKCGTDICRVRTAVRHKPGPTVHNEIILN